MHILNSVKRDLEGENPRQPMGRPDTPGPPVPRHEPESTRIEGPWGLPWEEGLESPDADIDVRASADPRYPVPDVGATMGPGAYEGAYRTRGPVRPWGHVPSGGLWGDQAIGRIMRFPVNLPDRYDANGVHVGDYKDVLVANVANAEREPFDDNAFDIDDLLHYNMAADEVT